ncbi:MAG TPA: phosphoadenylyl-sulfate reductase [Opitutaceae bacterium]|jgi:phosphoadenosine phosphosulfate reductase|nr:phosphoadenylyl-sulfate reductase [Opitutaceae bacterium]
MATADVITPAVDLAAEDQRLSGATPEERISWALSTYGDSLVLSTSFGAQAAVMLHMASKLAPQIPVVFIDTGYLFPETYLFADTLTKRLKINLKVYRSAETPAWIEARHGKLWEQGAEGLAKYNQIVKVEPMQRALSELGAKGWLAGLRRVQASTREKLPVVSAQDGRTKVLPIVEWTDRDVFRYLTANELPYHPLWEKGYVSIGDVHTTRPLSADMTAEETRFFGLKRECGIHDQAAHI